MFFAKPNQYEPAGIFTTQHVILIILTITGIYVALKRTVNKSKEDIKKIIKTLTIIVWILEFIKIGFKFYIGKMNDVNEYLPLYYCSLLLYAGLMSSFGKGKIKRMGDVFLATGGIIGGIVFIIMPTTSLPTYPMLHYLSLHSFLYHGIMVYIGLLMNATHYIELELKDIIYFSELIGGICMISLVINRIFDSNLMFISKDFPGTPLTILYHLTGKLFTPIMIVIQMTLPFLVVYSVQKEKKIKQKQSVPYKISTDCFCFKEYIIGADGVVIYNFFQLS